MARLNSERVRTWIGRGLALGMVAAVLWLGSSTLERVDRRPRTQDAFLWAESTGIAPEVSGRVVKVHVKENDRVRRGDPLIELDVEPFELRARQAHAHVAALEAQIALTTRQVAAQSSGAAAAATQIQRATSQLELAQDTVTRLAPLQARGYVTAQQLDEARTSQSVAQVAVTAARQQAAQARQAVGDTESLRAQLRAARSAALLAERDVKNTVVVAPFDGLVVGVDVTVGTFATTGRPLFTLIDATQWYAIGNFRETELSQIARGDAASVWMIGDANRVLRGRVESIGWGVKPEIAPGAGLPSVARTLNWVVIAQRFPVRIRLDEVPVADARIGASATIRVHHGD